MQEFLNAAQNTYKDIPVKWLSDSLPHITCLSSDAEQFDFVLIEGVWHHLDEIEREQAVMLLSKIIKKQGKCAISLRNGPAGVGTRVYPTDSIRTVEQFKKHGFECVLSLQNQSSILRHKENVKWSRIVLQKK